MFIIGYMQGCEEENRTKRNVKRELRELRQDVAQLRQRQTEQFKKPATRSFFDPKPPYDEGR